MAAGDKKPKRRPQRRNRRRQKKGNPATMKSTSSHYGASSSASSVSSTTSSSSSTPTVSSVITFDVRSAKLPASATAFLTSSQIERLRSVLSEQVEIHGRGNFPTLDIQLHQLIVCVREKLFQVGCAPGHVKMNGGAASYVLATEDSFPYSDLDLIFPMSLETDDDFDRVRAAVFNALVDLMPESINKDKICAETLKDIYIRKMVKVSDGDRWSLFSLHNDFGRCIELKFVDTMRRQFEFSVDSFQITLDELLDDIDSGEPMLRVESMYGDMGEALRHLNERLIDTRHPEEIRGGGLLKYCHLLIRGYRLAHPGRWRKLQAYMCSRFFIDFPDLASQQMKLIAYLDNHFGNEIESKYNYLHKLRRVISDSTVCLMSHERRQTLDMVYGLACQLQMTSLAGYRYAMVPSPDCCCSPDGSICGGQPSTSPPSSHGSSSTTHTPRQALYYLPTNADYWIQVV
ncbi:hypothetical protein QR680_009780 [Steinernema hermaphroditum]|uniref:polynucleotide adenylyltransferase n=1 Tax=Steinernema hermaphroditum TaxID=289476 RepID=A0AA39ILM5_9BILA|nr:hypothetical protein QR680_009780 [Steinernema hermaphroditum]